MKKKWLSLALAIVMLAALCIPAAAAGAEISAAVPEGIYRAGETFTVPVLISANPGFNTLELTLNYDETAAVCTEITEGAVLSGMMCVTNPEAADGAVVAAAATTRARKDGVIAEFTFRALKDLNGFYPNLTGVKITDLEGNVLPCTVITSDPKQGTEQEPETPAAAISFPDAENHWGRENILRAAQLGLFSGYSNGNFGPEDNVTRAQFVTVLWRMAGKPAAAEETPFTDLNGQSEEFRTAIAWAYSKGYINGKSADTFDPTGNLTREAAMKILYLYNGGISGIELLFTSAYDAAFSDSGTISSWAKAPMYWGVYNKIISGTSATTLSPGGYTTRAQLATILVHYYDDINS